MKSDALASIICAVLAITLLVAVFSNFGEITNRLVDDLIGGSGDQSQSKPNDGDEENDAGDSSGNGSTGNGNGGSNTEEDGTEEGGSETEPDAISPLAEGLVSLSKTYSIYLDDAGTEFDGLGWTYRVSKEKLAALESSGYTVSFGGVLSIRNKENEVFNTVPPEVVYSEADATFSSTLTRGNQCILVYSSPGSPCEHNATGIFDDALEDGSYKYFNVTLRGLSEVDYWVIAETVAFVNISFEKTVYDHGGFMSSKGL